MNLIEEVKKYYVYHYRTPSGNDTKMIKLNAMYEEIIDRMKNCNNCKYLDDEKVCDNCEMLEKWRLYEG